jgi:hypothetical protein
MCSPAFRHVSGGKCALLVAKTEHLQAVPERGFVVFLQSRYGYVCAEPANSALDQERKSGHLVKRRERLGGMLSYYHREAA